MKSIYLFTRLDRKFKRNRVVMYGFEHKTEHKKKWFANNYQKGKD